MVHTPHSSDAENSQVFRDNTLLIFSEATSNMRSNPVKLVGHRTLPACLKICLHTLGASHGQLTDPIAQDLTVEEEDRSADGTYTGMVLAGERQLQQCTGLMKHFWDQK